MASCAGSGVARGRVACSSPAPPGARLDQAARAPAPMLRGCSGAFSDARRAHARVAADRWRVSSSSREDLPSRWALSGLLRRMGLDGLHCSPFTVSWLCELWTWLLVRQTNRLRLRDEPPHWRES